ncbi:anti-sigma factor [Intrasporangium calvum]|uniref:anti-sigma factor n=1 Tax=Intrasporangium calvum TaxID=53358 RepID=UPI000DF61743|nr:anti-sigma factor [Intrasporangium calvum]AXG15021.1 anti-sigma factor [Intrasporangium calvum]
MTDDIHALSGAYAVDALDELERVQFEQHLAGCPACRAEVAGLREAAAQLAAGVELPPPPALRGRLMSAIAEARPLPPVRAAAPATEAANVAASPARPWRRVLVAAAAAAVLGVTGVGIWQAREGTPAPTVAEQVLDAPDALRTSQSFTGGATATVVRSPSLGRAVLVTSRMPAAPDGKVYQLWLQDSTGHMVSAGVMPAGPDQVVVLQGDARTATAAGISLEPTGGSQQPTTDPIALFAFT